MRQQSAAAIFLACVTGLSAYPPAATQRGYEATPEVRVIAERVLALSGGRDAWKDVRSLRALAVNRTEGIPLPYLFEIAIDFREPRTITRLLNQDMDRLRGYLGTSGWGVKESGTGYESYVFPPERLPLEHVLWEGAFSRNLWRLAIEDTTLAVRSGPGGRLEFHNRGGTLTAWFALNEDGYPVRFGFPGDDQGLTLGEYATYGPRRIPRTGATPEGVFFETLSLRASDQRLEIPPSPPSDLRAFPVR